ncbi:VPS4 [Acanthosepion pharaonis]|uniref:VPS4 n=1 Tax=Acanthosepion pharaonis TaxID=158019 RepID=A0A812CX10_ACAPH|nr:VPS4 [Sepia pharaonis]
MMTKIRSIKELFQHACQSNSRSVIFIDEIDSICRKRNIQEAEHTRRFKTELLKQMEGVGNIENGDKVFLLLGIVLEARIELLKIHTKDSCINISDEEWQTLGQKTELYSGSDIANLTLGALFQPIREMQNAKYWKHLPGGRFVPCDSNSSGAIQTELKNLPADLVIPKQVQLDDFLKSMKTHSKTISETDLVQFTQFAKSYSQTG